MAQTARVAVLIDCDNISWRVAKDVLAETAKHGTLSIKRGYGDWASANLGGWRAELSTHAIQPIQQFAHVAGKNATDSALIIDAMDLLYSGNIDTFCIVSSDSDFTSLAMRLRASGRTVYGIGSKFTHESFRSACDRFTFTDVLAGERLREAAADQPPGQSSPGPTAGGTTRPTPPADEVVPETEDVGEPQAVAVADVAAATIPDLGTVLKPAIEASAKESGWSALASVGWYVVNSNPSFDSRNYGYPKLGALVRDLPYVETKEMPDASGFPHLWVRLKPGMAQSRP